MGTLDINQTQDTSNQTQDTGNQTQDTSNQTQDTNNPTRDTNNQILDTNNQTQDTNNQTQDTNNQTGTSLIPFLKPTHTEQPLHHSPQVFTQSTTSLHQLAISLHRGIQLQLRHIREL